MSVGSVGNQWEAISAKPMLAMFKELDAEGAELEIDTLSWSPEARDARDKSIAASRLEFADLFGDVIDIEQ